MLRGKQVCDKGEQDNGESHVLFFYPEKWKFPIPSAYNTGRVSFSNPFRKDDHYDERHCKIKKNRAFVEQQNGEVEVASGQYVYLKVENCFFGFRWWCGIRRGGRSGILSISRKPGLRAERCC